MHSVEMGDILGFHLAQLAARRTWREKDVTSPPPVRMGALTVYKGHGL